MSVPKLLHRPKEAGFTLVELVVVMVIILLVSTSFYEFFRADLGNYLDLQKTASNFTDLASESERLAQVLRGITGVVSASGTDLTAYAYFSPSDTYVSEIHYYLNSSQTALMADVTRMTANPPIGTPISGSTTTYTIIPNFKQPAATTLFVYFDSTNTQLGVPVADVTTIQQIQTNLGVATAQGGSSQPISLEVSLRNKE
ncbi:MAG TPA: prepilin-type N-terminal cleavage/methylation domain-containing protein [Candidatus Saccharimonadales bacterium]|nr:prepilin-type N-terminal cleavage/methylation domain-containing protein [Candidatus Saccharimonadales bacterium]